MFNSWLWKKCRQISNGYRSDKKALKYLASAFHSNGTKHKVYRFCMFKIKFILLRIHLHSPKKLLKFIQETSRKQTMGAESQGTLILKLVTLDPASAGPEKGDADGQ